MVEHGVGVSMQEQNVERNAPASEAIDDQQDSFGLSDFVVLAAAVVNGVVLMAFGMADGAAGVVDIVFGVVDGAAGVVDGAPGVVDGAARFFFPAVHETGYF